MKKGVALIWAMVLCGILLIISGSMVDFITKESRFAVQIEDSGIAYANASSGIEWGLEKIKGDREYRGDLTLSFTDGSASVSHSDIVGQPGKVKIESTGVSNFVTRKIEYVYADSSLGTEIDLTSMDASIGANYGSFTLSYDFWGTGGNDAHIGLNNATDTTKPKLYLKLNGETATLKTFTLTAVDSSGTIINATTGPITMSADTNRNWSYRYRATIRYIEAVGAFAKIQKLEQGDENANGKPGEYLCVATANLDLSSGTFKDMGDLNSIYINATNKSYINDSTEASVGDGKYVDTWNAYHHIYIDNFYVNKS